jgi:phosphatidate cytidylyltransferase
MKKRVISGLLGAAFLVWLTYCGGLWLAAGLGFLVILGACEYQRLVKSMDINLPLPLLIGPGLVFILLLMSRLQRGWDTGPFGLVGLSFVVLLFITLLRELVQGDAEVALIKTGAALFGLVYPGVLLSYIILIRNLPDPYGMHLVIFSYALTWGSDTGAYFIGSAWGRHKLAPRISPKKSLEGAVGGLVTGTLLGLVYLIWAQLPLVPWILISPVAIILGQTGDLFESLIKRGAKIKDSGQFLPGHGGVLDRFDSLLFVAPFIYYIALLWLQK